MATCVLTGRLRFCVSLVKDRWIALLKRSMAVMRYDGTGRDAMDGYHMER